ncbi:MAG: PEP-CTERM sorting domain-containing protein [Tepidisphaeraceae bacterium]|jgi:hypothetical protein
MLLRISRRSAGPAAAISLAVLAPFAYAQQESIITGDTFIDSGSPGTVNPSTGQLNVPGSIVNGQDIYSYGADGKVKAVTSSYSSSYPFVSATHVLLELPQSFWNAIGNQPVASAIVSYYPFNDSLSVPDAHDNMELHPLTHAFTVGDGTQSPLVASNDGGAMWDSYDGAVADAWTTPGGDYDAANYVLASVTDSTLPPSKGSTPFSWNITSLINNPTTRAELEENGALIKVINEGIFPNNPPPPGGENDFVSFYSADYMTAMGTTDPSHLPNVIFTLANFTWNDAVANNLWDTTSSNWNSGSGNAVYVDGGNVTFNDSNGGVGNYAVTVNTTVSPGSVSVNNSSGNYTISGAGGKIADAGAFTKSGRATLTIGTPLSVGSMSITAGALKLATGVSGGTGPAATSPIDLTSLSITGNGVLDINNNHLIITYGASDPITTIAGYIASGHNTGNWNGPGIISSAALTNPSGLLYGIGYADGNDHVVTGLTSGQIEVAYTLLGDANLDGLVNGSDFNILAANFNQSITGWDQGDFNYDGLVNASDFNELAANFNQGVSGAASAGDIAALDAFAAANGLSLPTSSVPEPASTFLFGVLALGGLLQVRRSRRLGRA